MSSYCPCRWHEMEDWGYTASRRYPGTFLENPSALPGCWVCRVFCPCSEGPQTTAALLVSPSRGRCLCSCFLPLFQRGSSHHSCPVLRLLPLLLLTFLFSVQLVFPILSLPLLPHWVHLDCIHSNLCRRRQSCFHHPPGCLLSAMTCISDSVSFT